MKVHRSFVSSLKSLKKALRIARKDQIKSTKVKGKQRRLSFDHEKKVIRLATEADHQLCFNIKNRSEVNTNKKRIKKLKRLSNKKKKKIHYQTSLLVNQNTDNAKSTNDVLNETSFVSKQIKDDIVKAKELLSEIDGVIGKDDNSVQDDTDDCICMENDIEVITIEDDTPLKSNNILKRSSHLITSTPTITARRNPQNSSFFVDTNASPWYQKKLPNVPSYEVRRNFNKNTQDDVIVLLDDTNESFKMKRMKKPRKSKSNIKKDSSPAFSNNRLSRPANADYLSLISINEIIDVTGLSTKLKSNNHLKSDANSTTNGEVIVIGNDTLPTSSNQPTNQHINSDYIPLIGTNDIINAKGLPTNGLSTSNNYISLSRIRRTKKPFLFTSPKNSDYLSLISSDDIIDLENDTLTVDQKQENNTEDQNGKKRMIIIDGSNVAFRHSLNREFSVKGLKICIDHFEQKGHEVKAVVPEFRQHVGKSSDPDLLRKLFCQGKIIYVPGKRLPGKFTSCYDDRLILKMAEDFDGAVVSNDNYRDLFQDSPEFQRIIENRVISFTFCNDVFYALDDPYGRSGPCLKDIMNRV